MKKPISKFIAAVTAASCSAVVVAESAIEEVIVSSSRIEIPLRQIGTSVSVIDGAEIELRGLNSLADVLRTQPSINVRNSGGAGKATSLFIRGEEGYRSLVMIDGVDISDPTATQVGPRFSNLLTSNDVERVEILRGTQGFIYGADAGGVVNVFTKTGEGELGGSIGLEGGRYGTQQIDANISAGNETGDFFISATDYETDGFNARTDDAVLQDDDGAENTTVHAKLGWNATEDLRVQLVVRDISANTEFDQCSDPVTFVGTNDCIGESEQTTAKLSATYDIGNFSHLVSYANTDITVDRYSAGVFSSGSEGEINRAEYMGTYRFDDATTLTIGVDLEEEEVVTIGFNSIDTDRDQLGLYVEFNGELADNWFISAGLRNDDNDDFGSFTSGRLSTAYVTDFDNGSSIKYRASYGTGFRAPSLYEIGYNFSPNAFPPAFGLELAEETSEGYDLGIEYFTAAGARFELVYFDQEIEDMIDFDDANFSGYIQLDGTSTSEGVELVAEYPVTDNFVLLGNLTHNETEDANDLARVRRPELVGNLGFKFATTDEKFSLIASYRISKDAETFDFATGAFVDLDDYEVLDISASYDVNEMLTVFGRVENALDEDYQEVTDYNTSGSAAYAGVRFNF